MGSVLLSTENAYADDSFTLYQNAINKVKSGNLNQAVIDLNKAIEINPVFTAAYLLRADIKLYYKDYKGAISDYETALDINPKTKDIFY